MIGWDFSTIRGMGLGIEFPDTTEIEYEDDEGNRINVTGMCVIDLLIFRIMIISM